MQGIFHKCPILRVFSGCPKDFWPGLEVVVVQHFHVVVHGEVWKIVKKYGLPAFSCGHACLVANQDFFVSLDICLPVPLPQEVAVLALLPELLQLAHRLLRQEVAVLLLVLELPQLVDRLLRQHLEVVLPPRPRIAVDFERTRAAGGRHRAFPHRDPW